MANEDALIGRSTEVAAEADLKGDTARTVSPQLDPDVGRNVAALRSQVRESFGKVVMAMMLLPRYRSQALGDLQHLVLEPLLRDRVAIAYPVKTNDNALADITGLAIWASVSEEVDKAIREQIHAGVFPVRLKSEDWTSGSINWLLDVIAPDRKSTATVIANFKQLVKEGSLRLHPLITKLIDEDTLQRLGAERLSGSGQPAAEPQPETSTTH